MEESKAGRVHRKEEGTVQRNKARGLQEAFLQYLSIDQHMSIGKQPERIRNDSASLHTRPRIVFLPSRQTEPPQNAQRTGQSTRRAQGSVLGDS